MKMNEIFVKHGYEICENCFHTAQDHVRYTEQRVHKSVCHEQECKCRSFKNKDEGEEIRL